MAYDPSDGGEGKKQDTRLHVRHAPKISGDFVASACHSQPPEPIDDAASHYPSSHFSMGRWTGLSKGRALKSTSRLGAGPGGAQHFVDPPGKFDGQHAIRA